MYVHLNSRLLSLTLSLNFMRRITCSVQPLGLAFFALLQINVTNIHILTQVTVVHSFLSVTILSYKYITTHTVYSFSYSWVFGLFFFFVNSFIEI